MASQQNTNLLIFSRPIRLDSNVYEIDFNSEIDSDKQKYYQADESTIQMQVQGNEVFFMCRLKERKPVSTPSVPKFV